MASFNKEKEQNLKTKKYRIKSKAKYIKMVVIDDLMSETINNEVQKAIDKDAKVVTDDFKSYKKLKEIVKEHKAYNLKYYDSEKVLP